MDEPDHRDSRDHAAAGHDVPRAVDLREEGTRDVVGHEQGRQGDDDQVVEEEHPARDEAPEVVERDADERRSASGLANCRCALGVGQRDDQEEQAGRK